MSAARTPFLGPDLDALVRRAAGILREARRAAALTGAGVSVESGIPPFRRSLGAAVGLWERYDPMEYATIDAFTRDPGRVWLMLREVSTVLKAARPNAAHHALARMERAGLLWCVITQNIDGLHQMAGSSRVVELHGDWRTLVCVSCRRCFQTESISLERLPPLCPCGGALKPDVTLFGEIIPAPTIDAACEEARSCDCLLVVGTSADVDPAASFPRMARGNGAFIIEVNVEETPLSSTIVDLRLRGSAGAILPRLAEEAGVRMEN